MRTSEGKASTEPLKWPHEAPFLSMVQCITRGTKKKKVKERRKRGSRWVGLSRAHKVKFGDSKCIEKLKAVLKDFHWILKTKKSHQIQKRRWSEQTKSFGYPNFVWNFIKTSLLRPKSKFNAIAGGKKILRAKKNQSKSDTVSASEKYTQKQSQNQPAKWTSWTHDEAAQTFCPHQTRSNIHKQDKKQVFL